MFGFRYRETMRGTYHLLSAPLDDRAMELADALTGGLPRPPVKLTAGQGIDGASRPAWAR